MIARLKGTLVAARPACVVDVGGVGFEVVVAEKDRDALPTPGQPVEFHTYLYVREDRLELFGFIDPVDRSLFLKLIEVSGVGPKLALGILSSHPASRVTGAIRSGDVVFLKTLPGLGKKTAERLVMELGDRLEGLIEMVSDEHAPRRLVDEAVLALTSLGMARPAAEAAIEQMDIDPKSPSKIEDIVKEALKYAGKP